MDDVYARYATGHCKARDRHGGAKFGVVVIKLGVVNAPDSIIPASSSKVKQNRPQDLTERRSALKFLSSAWSNKDNLD